jgi:hypothetical protein
MFNRGFTESQEVYEIPVVAALSTGIEKEDLQPLRLI